MMRDKIRTFLERYPQFYDTLRLSWWQVSPQQSLSWKFFDRFSKAYNQKISFIQIGANDGLRNDPIRGFVVRDQWRGIFVEPLPTAFEMLKNNNRHLKQSDLKFVNAAISSSEENLSFWTYGDNFLSNLSLEEKLSYQRKSSFNKKHLLKHLNHLEHNSLDDFDKFLQEIKVPCLTLEELMQKYWPSNKINLLMIDAEGHESSIIRGINFQKVDIDVIYFESAHLGKQRQEIYDILASQDYKITQIGLDSIAQKISLNI